LVVRDWLPWNGLGNASTSGRRLRDRRRRKTKHIRQTFCVSSQWGLNTYRLGDVRRKREAEAQQGNALN
jgi:hypothetical protein